MAQLDRLLAGYLTRLTKARGDHRRISGGVASRRVCWPHICAAGCGVGGGGGRGGEGLRYKRKEQKKSGQLAIF